MKVFLPSLAIVCCAFAIPPAPAAPPPNVQQVMLEQFADLPGREGLMLIVTYPPGGADEIHRHDAHAFVYVLEGSIVMQLKGAEPVTLKVGQSFYEAPQDIHLVGRNASDTKPAKFVVFLVKNQGVPALIPAQ